SILVCLLTIHHPPRSPLFPYTTLFRSVMQRYGLSAAKFRNPYPLPGEDPQQTNGGSGQLPLGLIQGRDRDLGYNGRITISCSARSEEHTSELQSRENLVCRLLLEKKKK